MTFNCILITQRTHLHKIIPPHTSASTNMRGPVRATVQVATHIGSSPATALHTGKEGNMPPDPLRECDLQLWRKAAFVKGGMLSCYRTNTSTKESQTCTLALVMSSLSLVAQRCITALHYRTALLRCNTLKHKKTYTRTSH